MSETVDAEAGVIPDDPLGEEPVSFMVNAEGKRIPLYRREQDNDWRKVGLPVVAAAEKVKSEQIRTSKVVLTDPDGFSAEMTPVSIGGIAVAMREQGVKVPEYLMKQVEAAKKKI